MVELTDCEQQETEGKLQFHSRLTLMERTFASLKFRNLKARMQGTCCIPIKFQTQGSPGNLDLVGVGFTRVPAPPAPLSPAPVAVSSSYAFVPGLLHISLSCSGKMGGRRLCPLGAGCVPCHIAMDASPVDSLCFFSSGERGWGFG